ncbi:MAG: 4Fe-4S binding protein [Oscillospiraceae bacterium]|jgi:2-oxoglutarate ferredoxin oxidoreductase subunit delta|nr:4Fe-4S binding protein [Oscillospiraceae bacterium]
MPRVIIDENICKGCSLCVTACPKDIVALNTDKLNAKGYHTALVFDPEKCIGCAMCAIICPDCAITVNR